MSAPGNKGSVSAGFQAGDSTSAAPRFFGSTAATIFAITPERSQA